MACTDIGDIGETLLKEIVKLVASGDLHVTSFTPPGGRDGEFSFTLRSRTGWERLADALKATLPRV